MGLRIAAEVLTLKKENVDLENGLQTIEVACSNGRTQTMPIHSCLIDRLRAHDGEHQQLPLPRPERKPMHDIRASFENACAASRIS